ncbi:hypothetical protein ILUMI_01572 [Ignelater luminosus]|uniref:Uncharacterized protein n=1 Tax=Ignelater luminosus TaxID=2038154 RepID=A0A8K0DQF5_IGNLU|nr:hypothetical protein ILUMI_01572 [Ignelater luminosus]
MPERQNIACQQIINMKFVAVFLFALMVGALGYNWFPEELECVEEQKLDKAEIEALIDPWEKPSPEDNKDKILELGGEEIKRDIEKDQSDSAMLASMLTAMILQGVVNKCREQEFHGSTPGQVVVKVQNCVKKEVRDAFKVFNN